MKRLILVLSITLILFFVFFSLEAKSSSWPSKEWHSSTPEKQGIDSEELMKIFDFVRENDIHVHSLLFIRNGYIVLDSFFYPYEKGKSTVPY
jgi:hypothetical protein